MRVFFSRTMAAAVAAMSIAAITSTGCNTMSRAPGAGWVSSWWHKEPAESYASRTPPPSQKSTPVVATSLGNASEAPKDPTITPYGGGGIVAQAQPGSGYPTQGTGAIQPNYAISPADAGGSYGQASGGDSYASMGNPYNAAATPAASTQVTPGSQAGYGQAGGYAAAAAPNGNASIYAGATQQANSYGSPYGESPGYQTADARNSTWGGASGPAPASAQPGPADSSIQPYGGGSYSAGAAQPYGNFTPPPSYTPPASNSYAPASGYGAATVPGGGAPISQPSADGYAPGSTSRYTANERQQPAPVDGAGEMFNDDGVAPAGYQNSGYSTEESRYR